VNLAAAGTIESYILSCSTRDQTVELVVGELDLILGEFGGAQKFEVRLADEWLAAENDEDFERRVETLSLDLERSSAAGHAQEQLNSAIAPDDNATRLERRSMSFRSRAAAARPGTSHLVKAAGWEAKRQRLGVHVTELIEAPNRSSRSVR